MRSLPITAALTSILALIAALISTGCSCDLNALEKAPFTNDSRRRSKFSTKPKTFPYSLYDKFKVTALIKG